MIWIVDALRAQLKSSGQLNAESMNITSTCPHCGKKVESVVLELIPILVNGKRHRKHQAAVLNCGECRVLLSVAPDPVSISRPLACVLGKSPHEFALSSSGL